jgi:hypothetical protein
MQPPMMPRRPVVPQMNQTSNDTTMDADASKLELQFDDSTVLDKSVAQEPPQTSHPVQRSDDQSQAASARSSQGDT